MQINCRKVVTMRLLSPNISKMVKQRDTEKLVRLLGDHDQWIRRLAAEGLGEIASASDRAVIERLLDALRDSSKDIQLAALAALVRIGAGPALEACDRAMNGLPEHMRLAAVRVLDGLASAEALDLLKSALKDDSADVRKAATDILTRRTEDRARYLETNGSVDELILALTDEALTVRAHACLGLAKRKDARAVEPLIRALKDVDGTIRREACVALGETKDARAVEPLITALEDSSAGVRGYAALALCGFADERALSPLGKLCSDESKFVREKADLAWRHLRDTLEYLEGRAIRPD
jgi:HEAT repeat protein